MHHGIEVAIAMRLDNEPPISLMRQRAVAGNRFPYLGVRSDRRPGRFDIANRTEMIAAVAAKKGTLTFG